MFGRATIRLGIGPYSNILAAVAHVLRFGRVTFFFFSVHRFFDVPVMGRFSRNFATTRYVLIGVFMCPLKI